MYIIGDTHGHYHTLCLLLDQLPDWRQHGVVIAGDLCDRGPDSSSIYQRVIDDPDIKAIKGNHDDMFAKAIAGNKKWHDIWLDPANGGQATFDSYHGDMERMRKHAYFAQELPYFLEYPDLKNEKGRHLVVSHNIMNGQYNMKDKLIKGHEISRFESQVLWGNQYKIKDNPAIYNVTGHFFNGKGYRRTPRGHNPYEPILKNCYAMIDTGCGFDGGKLTALKFPEMEYFRQNNKELSNVSIL